MMNIFPIIFQNLTCIHEFWLFCLLDCPPEVGSFNFGLRDRGVMLPDLRVRISLKNKSIFIDRRKYKIRVEFGYCCEENNWINTYDMDFFAQQGKKMFNRIQSNFIVI